VLERVDYESAGVVGVDAPELPPAWELFRRCVRGNVLVEEAGPLDLIDRIVRTTPVGDRLPHPTSAYPSTTYRSSVRKEKLKDLAPM